MVLIPFLAECTSIGTCLEACKSNFKNLIPLLYPRSNHLDFSMGYTNINFQVLTGVKECRHSRVHWVWAIIMNNLFLLVGKTLRELISSTLSNWATLGRTCNIITENFQAKIIMLHCSSNFLSIHSGNDFLLSSLKWKNTMLQITFHNLSSLTPWFLVWERGRRKHSRGMTAKALTFPEKKHG